MSTSDGLTIAAEPWGEVGGRPVRLWTLANPDLSVQIAEYGGLVQSLRVPDRHGETANVVLGFPALSDYVNDLERQPWPAPGGSGAVFFGSLVGRCANRIAGHSFALDGGTYELEGNNGPGDVHTLHSGSEGWHRRVWSAQAEQRARSVHLRLGLVDPDGTGGFPGEVTAGVVYTLDERDALRIDYHATTSRPTVVNPTNHTYWNLAGEGSGDVLGHRLQINARRFTPTDDTQIPTGEFVPVAGTPFDFRAPKPVGRDIRRADLPWGSQLLSAHGYDHNFVLDGTGLRLAAIAAEPGSGRELYVYTTEPGLQLYTGNFLAGDLAGPRGRAYRAGDAFALETQHHPDSPHHLGEPGWPSVVLRPGQRFASTTVYRFRTPPA